LPPPPPTPALRFDDVQNDSGSFQLLQPVSFVWYSRENRLTRNHWVGTLALEVMAFLITAAYYLPINLALRQHKRELL
jgi:ABC-type uncharacterized transport system permease subunit